MGLLSHLTILDHNRWNRLHDDRCARIERSSNLDVTITRSLRRFPQKPRPRPRAATRSRLASANARSAAAVTTAATTVAEEGAGGKRVASTSTAAAAHPCDTSLSHLFHGFAIPSRAPWKRSRISPRRENGNLPLRHRGIVRGDAAEPSRRGNRFPGV